MKVKSLDRKSRGFLALNDIMSGPAEPAPTTLILFIIEGRMTHFETESMSVHYSFTLIRMFDYSLFCIVGFVSFFQVISLVLLFATRKIMICRPHRFNSMSKGLTFWAFKWSIRERHCSFGLGSQLPRFIFGLHQTMIFTHELFSCPAGKTLIIMAILYELKISFIW